MTLSTRKIALVGNPNVGKSLLFSRITGIGVIAANYPGTTVEVKTGAFRYREREYELIDIPGIYSLEAFSKADETALRLIDQADIIVNVIDATSLERNLNLTLQLLMKRKPMVVCCNFWDDTVHKGVSLDSRALETILGVPVVVTSALRQEGISDLAASCERATTGAIRIESEDQWKQIGFIVGQVQKLTHRRHTFWETLGDVSLHPVGGLVCAVIVLVAAFSIIRYLGEGMGTGLLDPLFSRYYHPFIVSLSMHIPWKIAQSLLIGNTADPLLSFGILTSGVYIAAALVFPYFFSFYLVFGFLEDSGYLPRLAVVLDPLLHRLGLHGHSSIPAMLGFGCKVPAFLATRVLTGRREKLLTISLCLMAAPCLPQSAMIVSLGMRYGLMTVISVFSLILIIALLMNAVLNKLIKGEPPELFIELPSYRIPSVPLLCKKLWLRIADYFREIVPLIIAGVLIIHLLDSLKIFDILSNSVGKLLSLLLGLPHEITPVLFLGFLRKDVSIALLAPFHLNAPQFIVAGVFMTLYLPCIASFFVLIRELGIVDAMKIIGMTFFMTLIVASALHVIMAWPLKML